VNPWPLGDLQTDITMHWVINARGMANSLNPLEHPWNFDSATVAKHRLRAVTRADREACSDGKWVASRRRPDLWDILIVGADLYLDGRLVESESDVARYFKPRYRWERRR